eukprot:3224081-Rhodomonas_salina.1
MSSKRRTLEALGQCVSHVVCACALDKYHGSVPDQVEHKVASYVDVPREFTVHGFVRDLDAS